MNCDYGHMTDSMIRDAIIMGVNTKKTQECLLRENDPPLDRCIDIVKATERARQYVSVISPLSEKDDKDLGDDEDLERMEVDKIQHKKRP